MKKIYRKIKPLFYSGKEKRHALVGPPKKWQMKRQFQIDFLTEKGLQPDHYLMDIGCGTLRGGVPLISYLDAGHYYGIEARADVLKEGEKELTDHNLTDKSPVLTAASDLAPVRLNQKFDFIWSFSVLIHMADEIVEGAFALVDNHIADDGSFYANVNFGEREDAEWQGFPVVFRSEDFYREMAARHHLQMEVIGDLKSLGHNSGSEGQDSQVMLRFYRG